MVKYWGLADLWQKTIRFNMCIKSTTAVSEINTRLYESVGSTIISPLISNSKGSLVEA